MCPAIYRGTDDPTPPELERLRVAAVDEARARDWPALWARRHEMRADGEWWYDMWAPLCAVAARHLGEPSAARLLTEAVEGGFCQPDLYAEELADAFGDDPDWPELSALLSGAAAPAPVEFSTWPTQAAVRPLRLQRAEPERAAMLVDLLPSPADDGWRTATRLLGWVCRRWRHGNAHVPDDQDAVDCLRRVEAGERFACVEYTLVLSQALNALGIPARQLQLRQDDYHVGVGRCHVATEVWIDAFGRWVVLDGQHGGCWVDETGDPLSAVAAHRRWRAGQCLRFRPVDGCEGLADAELAYWSSLFAHLTVGGQAWAAGTFVPVFQRHMLREGPVLRDVSLLYPDLSEIEVGITRRGGAPALRMSSSHPYADGFRVVADGVEHRLSTEDPVWTLDTAEGAHELELAVCTRYGVSTGRPVRYRCGSGRESNG